VPLQEIDAVYLAASCAQQVIKLFACAQQEHMQKFGSTMDQYILVATKNRKQAINNPYATLNVELSADAVKASGSLCGPIFRAQGNVASCKLTGVH